MKPLKTFLSSLSIRGKVMFVTMLTCVIALFVGGAVQLIEASRQARSNLLDDLRVATDGMAINCAAPLDFDDDDALEQALSRFRVDSSMISAAVYDSDGLLFAEWDRDGLEPSRVPRRRALVDLEELDGAVSVTSKIERGGMELGMLYVRSDLSKVNDRILVSLRSLLLSIVGSLLLAYLISSRARGLITNPIHAMADKAAQVRKNKDYSLRMHKRGNDEIGDLIDSFNAMLAAIERRDDELNEHRGNLEFEVRMRTRELRETNVELIAAKDEAENALRIKADFLANMSHEIRTPMNGVIGMTALLLESSLQTQQQRMVETVRSCGDHLLSIINDILDFSKIEADKLVLENIPFDLRLIAEEVADMIAPRCVEHGVEVLCLVPPSVPRSLMGDPSRLKQVLLNLGANAAKFTEKGEIAFKASVLRIANEPDRLELRVDDTGIGIAADRIDSLFQSFSQVDASTTREYGGTGLGLAICEQLVELMEGEITVESTPGEGSSFIVRIPLKESEDCRKAPGPLASRLRGERILVVDANAKRRKMAGLYLSSMGATVDMCATAKETGALLLDAPEDQKPYAFVLLDHQVGPKGGLKLGLTLRETGAIGDSPLLVCAPLAELSGMREQFDNSCVTLLSSPLKHTQLRDALYAILDIEKAPPHKRKEDDAPTRASLPALMSPAPRLSRQDPEDAEEQESAEAADTPIFLMAEDNEMNRQVITYLLERNGYRCDIAKNGLEAVELYESGSYDLIFMDCQMPVMDGFESTRRIRQLEGVSCKHTPIIAMTANALSGDRERCAESGMDDYISKPLDIKKLLALIEGWLESSKEGWRRGA